MAMKVRVTSSSTLFPLLSFEELSWKILPTKFPVRTIQLLLQQIADLHFDSRREQVYKISERLAHDMQIAVTDAELSSTFGRKGP
jgi:hypothetical protein